MTMEDVNDVVLGTSMVVSHVGDGVCEVPK